MVDPRNEKRHRKSNKAMPQHEMDAQALREKSARLRELRLAQGPVNASVASPTVGGRPGSKKPKPGKKVPSLSDWLATQRDEGRRG